MKIANHFLSLCKAFFAVFKKSFNKKATINYPQEMCVRSNKHRGKHKLDKSLCVSCKMCSIACPNRCISIKESEFLIDYERCCFCGNCIEACPTKALKMTNTDANVLCKRSGFAVNLLIERD